MPYPDYEAVDNLVHVTLTAAGFSYTNSDGEDQIDNEALKTAVYERMVDNHVVDNPKKMAKGAVTQHELYAAVLPAGPGASRQPVTEEERLAREELQRKLWNFTNTGVTGYVNKRVETEGLSLIMCEAAVARTYRSEETGRMNPVTEPGRFLTDHPDLIENYSTLPRATKLVKAAEAVAKHMSMAVRRHPELVDVITRQIKGALNQSRAAMGAAATTKPVAALTASSYEETASSAEEEA